MRSLLPPLMAGLITACVVVSSAIAQPAATECSQSVKIIVSYPPGSPDDVIAENPCAKTVRGRRPFPC